MDELKLKIAETKEKLAEKKVMFWIRMLLRALAWGVLCFMTYYKILKPIMNDIEVKFTSGDKQVFFWCGLVLLAIEAIKKVYGLVITYRFGGQKK